MPHPRPPSSKIAALKKRFGTTDDKPRANAGERRVQKNLRLPESAAGRLAELARREGVSQAELVVKSLEADDAPTGSLE